MKSAFRGELAKEPAQAAHHDPGIESRDDIVEHHAKTVLHLFIDHIAGRQLIDIKEAEGDKAKDPPKRTLWESRKEKKDSDKFVNHHTLVVFDAQIGSHFACGPNTSHKEHDCQHQPTPKQEANIWAGCDQMKRLVIGILLAGFSASYFFSIAWIS